MKFLYSCAATALLLLLTASGAFASMNQFAGSWSNVDSATGGITSLQIDVSGSSAQVHAWGSCTPTDCDWGAVEAQAFASSVSSDIVSDANTLVAVFNSGFSEKTLVIKPSGNKLKVDSYDRFLDSSGRSNYIASYTFQKQGSSGGSSSGGPSSEGASSGGSSSGESSSGGPSSGGPSSGGPSSGGPSSGGPSSGGSSSGGSSSGGSSSGGSSSGTSGTVDLTGIWNCDDGGKYYVRQIGTTVWWFGEQSSTNPSWTNVMRGTISGSMINAEWSDVPMGSIMSNGNLVLQIVSSNQLTAISKTGGFGGSVWPR